VSRFSCKNKLKREKSGNSSEKEMNAAQTKFGKLFVNLLDNLLLSFPECKQTATIHQLVHDDPSQLNTIKLDWARLISPYNINSFKTNSIDYFVRIHKEVAKTHMFHQLSLCQKYASFGNNFEWKDMLCGYLEDLEKYALEDELVDGSVPKIEEPTTPLSDLLDEKRDGQRTQMAPQEVPCRFDDADLIQMCVERMQDPALVNAALEMSRGIPELSEMYGDKTNEEIANQVQMMQPMLPLLMKSVQAGFPLQQLISQVQRMTATTRRANGGDRRANEGDRRANEGDRRANGKSAKNSAS
jgi:hypothetical protein